MKRMPAHPGRKKRLLLVSTGLSVAIDHDAGQRDGAADAATGERVSSAPPQSSSPPAPLSGVHAVPGAVVASYEADGAVAPSGLLPPSSSPDACASPASVS